MPGQDKVYMIDDDIEIRPNRPKTTTKQTKTNTKKQTKTTTKKQTKINKQIKNHFITDETRKEIQQLNNIQKYLKLDLYLTNGEKIKYKSRLQDYWDYVFKNFNYSLYDNALDNKKLSKDKRIQNAAKKKQNILNTIKANHIKDLSKKAINKNILDLQEAEEEAKKNNKTLNNEEKINDMLLKSKILKTTQYNQHLTNEEERPIASYEFYGFKNKRFDDYEDFISGFTNNSASIKALMSSNIKKYGSYKIQISLIISYKKGVEKGRKKLPLFSDPIEVYPTDIYLDIFSDAYNQAINKFYNNPNYDISSPTDIKIDQGFINFYRTTINQGGNHFTIKILEKFSKSIINPQNDDNKCFYYAVSYGMYPELLKINNYNMPDVINDYLNKNNLIIDDSMLSYPVKLDAKIYKEFEEKNNICLYVFVCNVFNKIVLSYDSHNKSKINEYKEVNILLIQEYDNNKNVINSHYIYVKNPARLYTDKNNNHLVFCHLCNNMYDKRYIKKHLKKCSIKNEVDYDLNNIEDVPEKEKEDEYFCKCCMYPFNNKNEIEYHNKICPCKKESRFVSISKDFDIHFKHIQRQTKLPTYIVSDFESLLLNVDERNEKETMIKTQLHVPIMYSYKVISEDTRLLKNIKSFELYRGENEKQTMERFFDNIINISKEYYKLLQVYKKMNDLNLKQREDYEKASHCYICHKPFENKYSKGKQFLNIYLNNSNLSEEEKQKELKKYNIYRKVRDHNHFTGDYIGAAHSICNIQRSDHHTFIPLIFHNAKGYDIQHILKYLDLNKYNIQLSGINTNSEKSLSITLNPDKSYDKEKQEYIYEQFVPIKIIDSLQIFGPTASLDKLVENLKKHAKGDKGLNKFRSADDPLVNYDIKEYFKYMYEYFKENTRLILRKNLTSYDYFNDYNKFNNDVNELTNINLYTNNKTDKKIQNKLKIMEEVIKTFNLKTTGDYYELYLKCDVLELVDIIEFTRKIFLNEYKLDFLYYYGAPGYAWDAFLKMTNIKLDLLKDYNMVCFFKDMTRGGPAYMCKKYSKANNELLEDYNKNKQSIFIDYFDMNNLYGGAMKHRLPYKNFNWIKKEIIERWNKMIKNNKIEEVFKEMNKKYNKMFEKIGYCLEVDLIVPEDKKVYFDQYPLAPEKLTITPDMLSDYTKKLKNNLDNKPSNDNLLVQTLMPKYNYKVYYELLEFYIKQGMKINKIHTGIQFVEKEYLKPYIEKNTILRGNAKSEFEKDLFKLMNNSVYGKTMENVFNYKNIKYVNDNDFVKYSSYPSFFKGCIVNSNTCEVQYKGANVNINKPLYIGPVITDIAKLMMFKFHYEDFIPEFGLNNIDLLFTDTDSLAYEIRCTLKERNEHYKNLINKGKLDTSSYRNITFKNLKEEKDDNKFYPLYSKKNKEIGIMKCEVGDKIITEFVGIRSKMYAYKLNIDKDTETDKHLRLKGVNKSGMKNITFNNYYKALFSDKNEDNKQYTKMNNIRSFNHQLYSINSLKVSICTDDTKRYAIDNIHTHAYGFN